MQKIGLMALFQDAGFKKGLASYQSGVQQATGVTEKAAGDISSAWKAVSTAGAVYLAKQVGQAIWSLGEAGAASLRLKASFQELSSQAGTSGDELLAAVQRATGGTVSELDIIAAANKGILLGLGAQADQWEQLSEVARFRARAMGRTVTQALDDITTGIGRESRMILDNLGIIIDTEQVMKDYAQSIGKTSDELEAAERKQAIMNEVISVGQDQIAEARGIVDDYADSIEEMNAKLANAKTVLAEELAPAVATVAEAIAVSVPGIVLRLQILQAAIQGTIDAETAWEAAAESKRIEDEKGIEAANAYVNEVIRSGEAVELATDIHGEFGLEMGKTREEMEKANYQFHEGSSAMADLGAAFSRGVSVVAEFADATADLNAELEDIAKASGKEILKAQESAGDDIEKANKRLADDLNKLWTDHTQKRAGLMRDLAQVDQELQNDLLAMEREAVNERLTLHDELLQSLADAEREYNQAQADAHQDLMRDLEDIDREYAEKREDLALDLNRDLEKIESKHLDKMADLEKDYYAGLEKLAEQYGDKLVSINQRYAKERQSIMDKYVVDPGPDIDEQREALMDALRELLDLQREGTTGIDYTAQISVIQKQLDELKETELALLEERKNAEIEELEKWYAKEQEAADKAYEEAQKAEEEANEKLKQERQRAFDQASADLETQQRREQEARKRAHQQTLDDLADKHRREEEEIQRSNAQRAADLETALAQEQADLEAAAVKRRADLQQQLSDEQTQYNLRYAELVAANEDRIEEINRALDEEILDIKVKAKLAAEEYINEMEKLGPDIKDLLLLQASRDLQPALDDWARRFKETGERAAKELQESIEGLTNSPPPWAIKIGADIAEGLSIGIGPDFGNLIASMVGGSSSTVSNSTTHNYNLNADFSGSNMLPGIRDEFRLMEMTSV